MKKTPRSKGICKKCKEKRMVSKLNLCQTCHLEGTITYWRDKLWTAFKIFIKERDADVCVTCGQHITGGDKQAGHFLTGASCPPTLYFHPKNVHPQCYRCNINLSGNWPEYYKFMEIRYGIETINELRTQKDLLKGERWSIERYKEELKKYEN